MRPRLLLHSAMVTTAIGAALVLRLAADGTVVGKPEDVGLSTERLGRITEMMKRHIAAGEISGGVTLVARRGRIAHLEALGAMDMESKKPMAKDAVFRIASMTKPVTGAAIMMMMEEGKLRITDPVSKYIPQFKDMKVAMAKAGARPQLPVGDAPPAAGQAPPPAFYTVPAERDITIRDLLTHTSGLVSGPMSNSEVRRVGARKPTDTLADFIPRLGGSALEFQPGTRWAYSAQAGFDTLGRIVEITSGQPFDQFLKQRLFDPLGMKDVSFFATDALAPRMPAAYQVTPNGVQKNTNASTMQSKVYFMGSGGLITTAEDYAKFAQMLLNGGELNGKRILSPRTVDFMKAVHIPDTLPGRTAGEGYGLSVRVIEHAAAGGHRISDGSFGWSGAYGTHFWVDPKEDIVAVMMIQTPIREMRPEFENAVMQAIVK
jgi:CubicO group peptidase (beta-lactamase class C family)